VIDDEHDREQALRDAQAATSPTTRPETRNDLGAGRVAARYKKQQMV
jgi:hypothetical protein